MPCMPPATHSPPAIHTPCHVCPPAMHAPSPAMHAPSPAMHAPCHAHPLQHTPHLPCMPPAMHSPLPCTAPCHTCPLPRTPPATHTPCHACSLTDACENITLPQLRWQTFNLMTPIGHLSTDFLYFLKAWYSAPLLILVGRATRVVEPISVTSLSSNEEDSEDELDSGWT